MKKIWSAAQGILESCGDAPLSWLHVFTDCAGVNSFLPDDKKLQFFTRASQLPFLDDNQGNVIRQNGGFPKIIDRGKNSFHDLMRR